MRSDFPEIALALLLLVASNAEEPSTHQNPIDSHQETWIPGPIAIGEFTAPAPDQKIELPAMRIEAVTSKAFPDRRVTVVRGEASTLPDIPDPVAAEGRSTDVDASHQTAVLANHSPLVLLQLSATIYDHKTSLVNWRHPGNSEISYEAVVGMDVGIFANVGIFVHKDVRHNVLLLHTVVDTAAVKRLKPTWSGPQIPEVAEGNYIVTSGNEDDLAGMAPLTKLLDLFAAERDRLIEANEARIKYHRDAEEWRKQNSSANQPTERIFWIRPHRGSRYLQAQGGAR